MEMKRLHAIVTGHVQMVGFRFFVLDEARRLGVTGWVRNGDDGRTVEVVVEGPEKRLRELEASLRQGPRHADVESLSAAWSDGAGAFESFQVRG